MGIFAPFVTRAMTRGATLTPYTTAVALTYVEGQQVYAAPTA